MFIIPADSELHGKGLQKAMQALEHLTVHFSCNAINCSMVFSCLWGVMSEGATNA
jgi:hypothetical protein